jgi:mRNA interferase RelE/StbE
MAWKFEISKEAHKDLKKLDKPAVIKILSFLQEYIANSTAPDLYGKHLTGDLAGLYRYRVGDYRIICKFEYDKLLVVAIAIGHRKNIYQKLRRMYQTLFG